MTFSLPLPSLLPKLPLIEKKTKSLFTFNVFFSLGFFNGVPIFFSFTEEEDKDAVAFERSSSELSNLNEDWDSGKLR